jgi:hypothetical protein
MIENLNEFIGFVVRMYFRDLGFTPEFNAVYGLRNDMSLDIEVYPLELVGGDVHVGWEASLNYTTRGGYGNPYVREANGPKQF